jgi:hypothetical protein
MDGSSKVAAASVGATFRPVLASIHRVTVLDAIKEAFPALLVVGGAVLLVVGMVAAIRWAKRAGGKAAGLGGALMLMLSMGVVPPRQLQMIEEARESKAGKGTESGDPPARDDK